MSQTRNKMQQAVDQRGHVITRSMGLPIAFDDIYLGLSDRWAILFDFTDAGSQARVFTGISVENPSASSVIQLAQVNALMDTPVQFLSVGVQQFFTLDFLQFGPTITDETEQRVCNYILGKLNVAQGTQASGTLSYAAANPADGETVTINGIVYQFCDDLSTSNPSYYKVDIGASADASYTNLVNRINLTQRYVYATIDTGTDIVTLESNWGGTSGNAITLATTTSATPSGATLSGGTGGVLGSYHVW